MPFHRPHRVARAAIVASLSLVVPGVQLGAQQFSLVTDAHATASPYSATIGTRRVFICRPNLPLQSVWGTDVYTDDSSICSAAVHAGVITLAQGGVVTIVIGAGQETYAGSTRNGVESTNWASHPRSYTFDRATPARGQIDWGTSAAGLPRGFTTPLELTCPAGSATIVAEVAAIYGTDIYSDTSPLCVAALHAGLITLSGGAVQFVSRGTQLSFAASTRNGVTSRAYGAWDGSFSLGAASAVSTATTSVTAPTSAGVTAGPLPTGSVTSPSAAIGPQTTASSPVTAVTTTATATATPISRTITGLKAVYTSGTTASMTWDKNTWMTRDQEFFVVDVWAENDSCPANAYIVDPKTCKQWSVADVSSVKFDVTGLDPSKNYYFRLTAMTISGSPDGSWAWSGIASQELYAMRNSILASPTRSGPINTTVMSAAPAPVLDPITGSPGDAALTWSAPTGAVRYEVWRKAGAGAAEQRTPASFYDTKFQDQIADPRLTYEYQVKAVQQGGSYGTSPWVSYTPPAMVNPGSFGGRLTGDGEVSLWWQPVTGVSNYRVDGPGLPTSGQLVSGYDLRIKSLQSGTQSWRIASVYAGNLMDLVNRPTATVTVPPLPWRSVPYLSMRNGAGSLTDEIAYYSALSQLKKGITDCGKAYPWECMTAVNMIINFPVDEAFLQRLNGPQATGTGGSPVFDVVFADMNNMGAGRHVYCTDAGTTPAAETLCWASTHGPDPGAAGWGDGSTALNAAIGGLPNRGWTMIRQGIWGVLFAAFDGVTNAVYSSDQYGPPKAQVVFDLEGAKRLPHACLACHGGKYDPAKATVVGASLIPIDPGSMVFSTGEPLSSAQEESVRQINAIVLNSNPGPAVAAYIRGLYGGNPGVAGTRSIPNYIPPGWLQAPDLYHRVVKPYCQGCHLQQQTLDFASYQNFVNAKATILTAVCTTRTMPHSEAALLAFWRDGGKESLPDYLAGALGLGKCAP